MTMEPTRIYVLFMMGLLTMFLSFYFMDPEEFANILKGLTYNDIFSFIFFVLSVSIFGYIFAKAFTDTEDISSKNNKQKEQLK